MTAQPMIELNDGNKIPQLGLGVFQTAPDMTAEIVREAIGIGYRHVDTAMIYENEAGVGEAVRTCDVPRDELFVTTKLWNADHGRDAARAAVELSLKEMGLDYIDLYLIHWPIPSLDRYVETWEALIRFREEGLVRSIGVSNFLPDHLDRLADETGVVPAVNQIELHPRFQQSDMRQAHARLGIATEAWAPLGRGAIQADPSMPVGSAGLLIEPAIVGIAEKHGRTPAQVIIRWHLDTGNIVIPKSARPRRLRENFAIFDFALDESDLGAIAALDDENGRVGPHPDDPSFAETVGR